MRIVVDMQGVQTASRVRGIGRYTASLIDEVLKASTKHHIVLVFNDHLPGYEGLEGLLDIQYPNVQIAKFRGVFPTAEFTPANRWRREVSERLLDAFIASIKPDLLLVTSAIEGYGEDFVGAAAHPPYSFPVVSILYDLIPLTQPEEYLPDPSMQSWYASKVDRLKGSDYLLAISEFTRVEAIRLLQLPAHKVTNISGAVTGEFRQLDSISADERALLQRKFGLPEQFVLYTSATDPRKNHQMLIDAFAQLSSELRAGCALVFVGGLPDSHKAQFEACAKRCGLSSGQLIITGRVTDRELLLLYNLCTAFVFPSKQEGFGLPVLEAMACGKAVIASNTSSLPEVIANEDAMFDPHDRTSIVDLLSRVLSDTAFREKLARTGKERSQIFTWARSAQLLLSAIEQFDEITTNGHNEDCDPMLIESIALIDRNFTESELATIARAVYTNRLTVNNLLGTSSAKINRSAGCHVH